MKTVQIGNERYYIYNKDDAVSLSHKLAKEGYSVEEIARLLGVKESTVRRYLSDCW